MFSTLQKKLETSGSLLFLSGTIISKPQLSNEETKVKSFVQADCLFPKVSLVDPELTLGVPRDQIGYGVCDIIAHT